MSIALDARVALAAWFALCCASCATSKGTVGAILAQQRDGRLFMREVPNGLAADQAGLRADDEVLLIDGRDVRAMGQQQVHAALLGEVGEPVKLTVIRGDQVIRVTLRRTQAQKNPVTARR